MSTPSDSTRRRAVDPRADADARRREWSERARRDLRRKDHAKGTLGMAFLELGGFEQALDGVSDEARARATHDLDTRIHDSVRESDLVCRWCADEYVVLFRGTTEDECLDAIRRVKSKIEAPPLRVDGREASVAATFGVVVVNSDESDFELELLMELAADSFQRARGEGLGSLCVSRG